MHFTTLTTAHAYNICSHFEIPYYVIFCILQSPRIISHDSFVCTSFVANYDFCCLARLIFEIIKYYKYGNLRGHWSGTVTLAAHSILKKY